MHFLGAWSFQEVHGGTLFSQHAGKGMHDQ